MHIVCYGSYDTAINEYNNLVKCHHCKSLKIVQEVQNKKLVLLCKDCRKISLVNNKYPLVPYIIKDIKKHNKYKKILSKLIIPELVNLILLKLNKIFTN